MIAFSIFPPCTSSWSSGSSLAAQHGANAVSQIVRTRKVELHVPGGPRVEVDRGEGLTDAEECEYTVWLEVGDVPRCFRRGAMIELRDLLNHALAVEP